MNILKYPKAFIFNILLAVSHPYDVIVDFVIKNSFGAVRLINNPPGELDILYPPVWITVLYLLGMVLLTPLIAIVYPFLRMRSLGKLIREPQLNSSSEVKWFFINGINTDYNWLELNCRNLEMRFNVGVTGIYNRSYGAVWDLVESILQREFDMHNASVRYATKEILRELKNKRNVRLIAHSQGAIIAGLVVKDLYESLSQFGEKNYLGNLELYTFANPSKSFKNPENLIKVVEHYANVGDPIARVGLLSNFNNFDGNIFINGAEKGHLFNRFYSLMRKDYKIRTITNPVLLDL